MFFDGPSIGTTLPIKFYAKKAPLRETFLLSKYKKSGACPDFFEFCGNHALRAKDFFNKLRDRQ